MICPLSPAHIVALGAFHFYIALLFFDVGLAPAPLLLFILSCLVAPFLPRLGFFLPVISRGKRGEKSVALTFDDGPDPEVTPRLLDLLDRHSVSATFFVTGANAERYPDLVRDLLSRGHAVGNHSYSHSPSLMLKGRETLKREIESAQRVFRQFGIIPLTFRPPAGITTSSLWRVLLELGMFCVNSSCRPLGMGNSRVAGLSARLLAKVAPRDIILLHDIAPRREKVEELLGEFETIIGGLRERGLEIVPLARHIGKEVMRHDESTTGPNPAALFYNALAAGYDQEQFCSVVSLSKRKEYELFSARLSGLFAGADRVLEVGAGTGIFTMAIARHCREVVAVDVSGNMLGILEKKAASEGVANIRTMLADVEKSTPEGTFSVVCAFSSLEYMTDLPALLRRLARHVEPGGAIYFITARRSLFRFFTQVGNAMRQGLWLKAHSRREIEDMLRGAGFEPTTITSHLLKSWISGGMLLEVVARRTGSGG